MTTKKGTPKKQPAAAGLTPAATSPASGRRPAPKPRPRPPYRGRFLPGAFLPALIGPVTRALERRQGKAVMDLLLRDRAGYFGTAWTRRNPSVLADCLPAAFEKPVATLVRMVDSGDVRTVPDLQVRIEQVLAVNARKYGAWSYKKLNPKLRPGRAVQSAGDAKASPMMFVSGVPAEKVDGGPRPDEAATAVELADLLAQARAALDPGEVQIFDAVQAHRVRHGVKNAYPAAVRALVAAGQGKPIPEGGGEFAAAVKFVRRTFFKVRHALAAAVAAGGYSVPPIRKPRGKAKTGPRKTTS